MAVPGSGTLWASVIRDEFVGGNPWYISDYYRGGPRVPNVAANNAIPTSGYITFGNFYGATRATLSLSPSPANGSQFRNEPAPSTLVVTSGCTASGVGVTSGTWTQLSGGSITISSPSSLSTSFSATLTRNSSRSGTFRFTANNGLTADVSVTLSYTTDA